MPLIMTVKHNLLLLTQIEVVASAMSANSTCSKAVSNICSKWSRAQISNLASKVTSLLIFSYYFKEEFTTNHTDYFAFQKENETKAQLKQHKFSGRLEQEDKHKSFLCSNEIQFS